MKFRRNYYFKLIWIFEYKRVQSFGGALFEGGFGNLFMLEPPRWSTTSIKLLGYFVVVALRHGCSPVDLVVLFGARFNDSTSVGLLLQTRYLLYIYMYVCMYVCMYVYIYIPYIYYTYIYFFPSTHLTHYLCVLKH